MKTNRVSTNQPAHLLRSIVVCGCMSIVLVICCLALAIGLALAQILTGHVAPAAAATAPTQVISLAPAIAEVSGQAQAAGPFFRQTVTVTYHGGIARLSSTADGTGGLATDDRVTIVVTRSDGSSRTYQRDFRNQSRTDVVPSPAEDISGLLLPGNNVLSIVLEDLLPPARWSWAYYLLLTAPTATPEPTSTATATRSATPAPLLTSTRTPVVSSTALPTASATATAEPVAAVQANEGNTPALASTPVTDGRSPLLWLALAGAGGAVAVVAVRRMRRPARSTMRGWLTVTDVQTGEFFPQIYLPAYPRGLLLFADPIRVLAAPSKQQCLARVIGGRKGPAVLVNGEETLLSSAEPLTIAGRLRLDYSVAAASRKRSVPIVWSAR